MKEIGVATVAVSEATGMARVKTLMHGELRRLRLISRTRCPEEGEGRS